MEINQIKNKYRFVPKWLKIILLIPIVFIALYFNFYTGIEQKYNTKNSVNPEATRYFVHATTVSFFIYLVHSKSWLDFDNPIFIPAYKLRDYFFEKGEKLVQEDNAENVLWWRVNYFEFYGFFQTSRNDHTMAIHTLDRDTQIKLKTRLYHYILKLCNYPVRGGVFSPITNLQDKVGSFVNAYNIYNNLLYEGNNSLERTLNYFKDSMQKERYTHIYKAISKLDINDDWEFIATKNRVLGNLLMFELHTQTISKETCYSQELYEYLSTVKKLYLWAKDTQSIQKEYVTVANDFLLTGPGVKNSIPQVTIDMVSVLCPKDTPILNLINEINNKEK
jgi:hypothetical protein